MSNHQTIEPEAFEVGVSPLFEGVTSIMEHDGHTTVVVLPPAAALAYAELLRQAAHKALERATMVRSGKTIDRKEIVPRLRGERLDS